MEKLFCFQLDLCLNVQVVSMFLGECDLKTVLTQVLEEEKRDPK